MTDTIDPGPEQLIAAVESIVSMAETATTKEAFRTAVSAIVLGAFEFGRGMGLNARMEAPNLVAQKMANDSFDRFTRHMLMAAVQRLAVAQRGPNKQAVVFPLSELAGIENFALTIEPDMGRRMYRLNLVRK